MVSQKAELLAGWVKSSVFSNEAIDFIDGGLGNQVELYNKNSNRFTIQMVLSAEFT